MREVAASCLAAALAAALGLTPAAGQERGVAEELITYVAFGDSITHGVGDGSIFGGPTRGYPTRLESRLQNAVVRNRGVDGERTDAGLTRIDSVLAEGGDVLLLMEGSNDVTRGYPLETTLFNLGEMARRAEQSGFTVIQATTIPRLPDIAVDPDNVLNQALNQGIRNLAGAAGRDLVDNFHRFQQLPNLFESYYTDLLPKDPVGHPNAAGYAAMADYFEDVLEGRDEVPPVPGLIFPNSGDIGVDAMTPIIVEVWDFGSGIALSSLQLRVDGSIVPTTPAGDARGATLRWDPDVPLSGKVLVDLIGRDTASPANAADRQIARWFVDDTRFAPGDITRDGRVDDHDLRIIRDAFGSFQGTGRFDPAADLTGDGRVNGEDLAIWAAGFGEEL